MKNSATNMHVLTLTVPLQCLWRDSVTLISTLLLTYSLYHCQCLWCLAKILSLYRYSLNTIQVTNENTTNWLSAVWRHTSDSSRTFASLWVRAMLYRSATYYTHNRWCQHQPTTLLQTQNNWYQHTASWHCFVTCQPSNMWVLSAVLNSK